MTPQKTGQNAQPKRALVISGGGARGAWGVGVCKALSLELGHHYQTVLGTSTGALMAPLVALRKFEQLETAYTKLNQQAIFNVNPFKSNGDINYLKFAWRIITKKDTLGETLPLKQLIQQYYTQDDHEQVIKNKIVFGVATTNFTNNYAEIKEASKHTYSEMTNWMWASANQPIFMSNHYDENGEVWFDGGLKEFLPIIYAIKDEPEIIDIIVHASPTIIHDNWQQKGGIFGLLLRTIDVFEADVGQNNIEVAKLKAELEKVELHNEVVLNVYYMFPYQMDLTYNDLIFDKPIMKRILKEGYQSVLNGTIIKETFKVG